MMMLDPDVLALVVKSEVGLIGDVTRHRQTGPSAINAVLQTAEKHIGRDCAVFWVDHGLPEIFSRPDLDPPVVVLSTEYLKKSCGLLTAVNAAVEHELDAEALSSGFARRITLEIISELMLRYSNDSALACHLFVTSLLSGNYWVRLPELSELEMLPIDESYMSIWFMTLTHELGHIYFPATSSNVDVSHSVVKSMIDEVAGRHAVPTRVHHSPLDPGVLGEELASDSIAVQLLILSTIRVMQETGARFSIDRMAVAILKAYGVFRLMNNCIRAARLTGVSAEEERAQTIADEVRFNSILDVLAAYIGTGGNLDETDVYAERIQELAVQLQVHQLSMRTAWYQFAAAHRRAVDESHNRRLQDAHVFEKLAGKLRDHPAFRSVARVQTARFLELARALSREDDDIKVLADLVDHPKRAAARLTRYGQRYFIIRVRIDNSDFPMWLPTTAGPTLFVFGSASRCRKLLRQIQCSTRSRSSFYADKVTAASRHAVEILIHRELPPDTEDMMIAFEGAADFSVRLAQIEILSQPD